MGLPRRQRKEERVGNRIPSRQSPHFLHRSAHSLHPLLTNFCLPSALPRRALAGSFLTFHPLFTRGFRPQHTPESPEGRPCPQSNSCVSFSSSHSSPRPRQLGGRQPAVWLPSSHRQVLLSPLQVLILLPGSLCHLLLIAFSPAWGHPHPSAGTT